MTMHIINFPNTTVCVFCGTELAVSVEYYGTWSQTLLTNDNGQPITDPASGSGYMSLGSISELQWNQINGKACPPDAKEAYIHKLYCSECRVRYEP